MSSISQEMMTARDREIDSLAQAQGRYRVLAKLGSGATADVFLGVQAGAENFQRLVVLKRIHSSQLESDHDGLRMSIDEARLVASLNHPHIVKIFDLNRMGDDICIAMEYIDGDNLNDILRACQQAGIQIPPPITCKLMIEACEALSYAHAAKTPDGRPMHIVHCDIGPQNLLLSRNGYLRIIDFGIAKSSIQSELTSPELLRGRLSYIAPDVFQHSKVDGRFDLYALGLVFFEMLTLQRAFPFAPNATVAEVIPRITKEVLPTVSTVRPDLSPEIDAVVAKATHKDRGQRYASGVEFADDIRAVAVTLGGVAKAADVEAWMQAVFPDRLAERRAFEKQALDRANNMPPQSAGAGFHNLQSAGFDHTHSREIPIAPAMPHSRVNLYGLAALVFAFFVAGSLVVHQLFWRSSSDPAGAPAPAQQAVVTPAKGKVFALGDNLFVESTPPGAQVLINDKTVGTTGSHGINLRVEPEQEHVVVIRLEGYSDYAVKVQGEAFGQRRLHARLLSQSLGQQPASPTRRSRRRGASQRHAEARENNDHDQDVLDSSHPVVNDAADEKPATALPATATKEDPSDIETLEPLPPTLPADTTTAPATVVRDAKPKMADQPAAPPPRQTKPTPIKEPVSQVVGALMRRRIGGTAPEYPVSARQQDIESTVSVKVTVGRNGMVKNIKFMKGNRIFRRPIKKAINTWRFKPYVVDGRSLSTQAVVKFVFALD